jgi:hypothetical protein
MNWHEAILFYTFLFVRRLGLLAWAEFALPCLARFDLGIKRLDGSDIRTGPCPAV